MASNTAFYLTVRFRKKEHAVQLAVGNPSTEEVASAIATATGAASETIKLLLSGKKGQMLKLTANPNQSAQHVGLESGMRVEVYASTKEEVEQVRNSKDLPGLASFEQELKQTMRRQRGNSRGKLTLPSGPYTFQKFEPWQYPGLLPVPSEAMKLLHRLAADPGIIGIMSKHRWTVGLLSEMPPEGKVGVSPVCILGVNINAGQEISLRLRTDDLKGFRRYDRIRETLCHELAHMVWGEHDNRFKELNSQLLKECSQLDWTGHAGHALSESHDPAFDNQAEPVWVDEDDIMAVTAQSSGQTLRSLGGGSQQVGASAGVLANPRRAAAMAASARLASASTSPNSSRSASPDILRYTNANPSRAEVPTAQEPPAASSSYATPCAEVAINPSADIASMGHRDPSTEQAEEAMRALGSMDFATEAASLASNTAVSLVTHGQNVGEDFCDQATTEQQQQQQLPFVMQAHAETQAAAHAPADMSQHHQLASSNSNSQKPTVSEALDAKSNNQESEATASEETAQAALQNMQTAVACQGHAQSTFKQDSSTIDADSSKRQIADAPQELSQQTDVMMEDYSDDPAVQRYKQAESAVLQLKSQAGVAGQQSALQTLAKILQNIVSHPGEPRYSHIRLGNAVFHSRAGQYAAARELLRVAGFTEEAEGAVDKALVWKRNDQGLLWLTLSAVNNALSGIA
ncbi:TPA: hypothetical protein ACH3X1_005894 [Trebouxia sp. C0004]